MHRYSFQRFIEMRDDHALFNAIYSSPGEGTPWGVFGDWYDEHGREAAALLFRSAMHAPTEDFCQWAAEAGVTPAIMWKGFQEVLADHPEVDPKDIRPYAARGAVTSLTSSLQMRCNGVQWIVTFQGPQFAPTMRANPGNSHSPDSMAAAGYAGPIHTTHEGVPEGVRNVAMAHYAFTAVNACLTRCPANAQHRPYSVWGFGNGQGDETGRVHLAMAFDGNRWSVWHGDPSPGGNLPVYRSAYAAVHEDGVLASAVVDVQLGDMLPRVDVYYLKVPRDPMPLMKGAYKLEGSSERNWLQARISQSDRARLVRNYGGGSGPGPGGDDYNVWEYHPRDFNPDERQRRSRQQLEPPAQRVMTKLWAAMGYDWKAFRMEKLPDDVARQVFDNIHGG